MKKKDVGILEKIAIGLNSARERYDKYIEMSSEKVFDFSVVEKHCDRSGNEYYNIDNASDHDDFQSELTRGDNIEYMLNLLKRGMSKKIKLIYIDPPFFTKSKFNATIEIKGSDGKNNRVRHLAYDDRFERNLELYIENISVRLLLIKDLLADDGLLWIHLDWHSVHYIKLIADEIFGNNNFINEIIWAYKSGGSSKKSFSKKHDTILVYSKTKNYKLHIPTEKSYNRGLKAYNFKGVREYQDEYGWYTLVNMKDIWHIDMVGRSSSERTGYATQKPVELMKRVIQSSSEPGDIVADFFCGSGSFLVAAAELDRYWIGCDSEDLAVSTGRKRLDSIEENFIVRSNQGRQWQLGKVEISCKNSEILQNGKSFNEYFVSSFEPDIETGYIQLNDRKYVNETLISNRLNLIDYIMVDPDYTSDEGFNSEILYKDDFDSMKFITRGNVAFIIVDVFGREYFYRINDNELK